MRLNSNAVLIAARTQPRDLNPRMKQLFDKLRGRGAKGAVVKQLAGGNRYNRWLLALFVKKGLARVQGDAAKVTSARGGLELEPTESIVDRIARSVAAKLLSQERVITPPMTRDEAWTMIKQGVTGGFRNGRLKTA